MTIKVMLVDDSSIIRRLLGRILDTDPELTIAGQAENGVVALERLDSIDPDVVVLDIEMPVMNGLETLTRLRRRRPHLPVIMFSTLTESGAAATLEALTRGADDYVTKPSNTGSFDRTAVEINATLAPKIKALHSRRRGPQRLRFTAPVTGPAPATTRPATRPDAGHVPSGDPTASRFSHPAAPSRTTPARTTPARPTAPRSTARPALIVIGVSTGGPSALAALIPALPADLAVPVLITQHMPPIFTRLLADRLDAQSSIRVAEAHQGATPKPGEVWFAPGGRHLRLGGTPEQMTLLLDDGPPVHSCKPAVDPLFTSAVAVLGARVLGVVLTGMGHDGFAGSQVIHAAGGQVIVQDEETSTVWGMPGTVAQAGMADEILALDRVVPALIAATNGSPRLTVAAPAPVRSA